jgi:hypothetical protein
MIDQKKVVQTNKTEAKWALIRAARDHGSRIMHQSKITWFWAACDHGSRVIRDF